MNGQELIKNKQRLIQFEKMESISYYKIGMRLKAILTEKEIM